MGRNFAEYEARNKLLLALGYASYSQYLASDTWKAIRLHVLDGAAHACYVCRKKATQVHHQKYTQENLTGKNSKWLIALCGGCHRNAEFHPKIGKTNQGHANKRINKLRRYKAKQHCWDHVPEYRTLARNVSSLKKSKEPDKRAKIRALRKQMRKLIEIAKNRAGSESPANSPQ